MKFSSGVRLKIFSLIISILAAIFGSINSCYANDGAIRDEIRELKARIIQLENKLARREGKITESKEEGISAWEGLNIGAGSGCESGTFWLGLIDDVRLYDQVVVP